MRSRFRCTCAMLAMLFSPLIFADAFAQKTGLKDLICEYKTNPLAIATQHPRLSWKLTAPGFNVKQTAYEIRVAASAADVQSGKNLVWSSGKVNSDQSIHVPYAGPELTSAKTYFWQVQVWDNQKRSTGWSPVQNWTMGLLDPADWKAKWITTDDADSANRPSPIFRKEFAIKKEVKTAHAYITAHGIYEAHINGQRVGESYLTPGWTSYKKRLQYQVYDVAKLLKPGANAVGAMLGSGWYRSVIGFENKQNFFGKDISLLMQIRVEYTDGTTEILGSDNSWKTDFGPVRFSEIYMGERYDANFEKNGWDKAGYNDSSWKNVRENGFGPEKLIVTQGPEVTKHERIAGKKLIRTPKGETVIDFGQNLVGWVHFKLPGKAGEKIAIEHAEVLDKAGNFYTENLRSAKQHVEYVFKGAGTEDYEAHFTFYGFRFIKISGYSGKIDPAAFTAVVVHSDMPVTGNFSASNPLLNQLQHNIQWGQKGNFVDVPTDCPQRDERLGWTGDAQAFSATAMYNMDVASFFTKWLGDVSADQLDNGSVPFVIPNILGDNSAGSTGWADVATIIPWNMYLFYGDSRILDTQYESMKHWVGFMQSKSKNDLWNTGFHFGDWLFYRPDDDNDGRAAVTDKYLIAQCFYAHSTQLLINAAHVLGKTEDERTYQNLLKKIKDAFVREYLTPNGRLVSGTQTAYVLALNFDMLPENLRSQAADRLAQNVKDYGNHLTTGFLGTPYLCHVLSRFGHLDVAYSLLMQESYPSWLYPVKQGATTIWERWDGQKPDGSFQTPGMNSFNHYAYGAIGDWMYKNIAGLNTDSVTTGYKKITITPKPGGTLTSAKGTLETLYGTLESSWKIENGVFRIDLNVPANTEALVVLPKTGSSPVTGNGKALQKLKEVSDVKTTGEDTRFSIGSGSYHFEYKM
ncbi:MAG: glycoside hydrolase family 78 protein [Mucilaginibacter polytrichastri]|nr:glycoside hydrolase family 78 protein [Mucilaginibacter polytrichastri]